VWLWIVYKLDEDVAAAGDRPSVPFYKAMYAGHSDSEIVAGHVLNLENLIQKVEAMDSRVPPNKTYPVCISIIHIQYVSSNMLFLLGNFGASPSAIRIAFCHVM
jgi:hypothetical protein